MTRGSWFDVRRARVRFGAALVAGVIAFAVSTELVPSLPLRALLAWDAFAATATALSLSVILSSDARETKRRANTEDPGRAWLGTIALAASAFSLFSAVVELREARALPHPAPWVAIVVAGIVLSWLLTHVSYAFRYAHLYFLETSPPLVFPEPKPAPNDLDFAYFAFTIGMTFQTSDVSVKSTHVRRAVLGHALLSFVYNTTILGLTVSLVASLVT